MTEFDDENFHSSETFDGAAIRRRSSVARRAKRRKHIRPPDNPGIILNDSISVFFSELTG